MVKQVIVVRKDLNMRKGKIAAQCAHSAIKVFIDKMRRLENEESKVGFDYIFTPTNEMVMWIEGDFTKVVVSVNSEKEIYDLANKAKKASIPYAVIIDNGFTEFHGEKTVTCIAIGPADSEDLDPITGDLRLL